MPGILLASALLALGAHGPAHAQGPALDPASAGTVYLLAFPDTVGTNPLPTSPAPINDAISLYIYSPTPTTGRITGRGYDRAITLAGGTFTRVDLNDPASLAPDIFVDVVNIPTTKTFRVRTESPVVLYCWVMTRAGGEAWTPLPVARWGREYHAAVLGGEVLADMTGFVSETAIEHRPKGAPAEIVVIASEDDTHVSFTRSSLFRRTADVQNHTVVLNRDEAYMVRGYVDAAEDADGQFDFGGTRIVADKPIGVISGNSRAQANAEDVGLYGNVYKNMLLEWLPPAEQYGSMFAFLPTYDSHRRGLGSTKERNHEYVRVYNGACAQLKGNYLRSDGSTTVPFTAIRDSIHELTIGDTAAIYFRTQQPAMAMMHSSAVIQLARMTPCDRGIPCLSYIAASPYMVEMVAREQWTTFAPYFGPAYPDSMENYVNVAADTASARRIYREDGTLFPFTRAIAGTDLVWGTDTVRPGSHYLEGRDGARFYAFAYGVREGSEDYKPGGSQAQSSERLALSYGYPLAPERNNLQATCNTLGVDAERDARAGGALALDGHDAAGGIFTIAYTLASTSAADLAVYDASGRRAATLAGGTIAAGEHTATWDASAMPSGAYYCRLIAGAFNAIVPIVVVR